MSFTENDILRKLDLAFFGTPSDDYPIGNEGDIKYNFFLDLEHGYCESAGNKIHLYADQDRWAIVFEKCGYQNRGDRSEIELNYVGNCINYPIDSYPERNYITNSNNISLITSEEYERIRNVDGIGMENFELISPTAEYVMIRDKKVPIEHGPQKYLDLGIQLREHENRKQLIGYGDIIKYYSDTNPSLVSATEDEIKLHIPIDIPKLLAIDKFHFSSTYDQNNPPRNQETYQLIAKVLVFRDPSLWKPLLESNNHWSNWESGHL